MEKVSSGTVRIFLHPVLVLNVVLLVAMMSVLALLSLHLLEVQHVMISLVVGWIVWTFTEYVLNRWVSHASESTFPFVNRFNRYHARHHDNPADIRYSSFHPVIVIISSVVLSLLAFMIVDELFIPFTLGFLFGYLLFYFLHVLQHHLPAPSSGFFLKGLWQNHFLHHQFYSHKAFGISTTLWDYLFNSLPPRHHFLTLKQPGLHVNPVLTAIAVDDNESNEAFLNVPESVFQHDNNWIAHLRPEISSIFDPSFNPYFAHGCAKRWIVINEYGEVLGRIAAFINFKKMYDDGEKVGCIGFFDCVDNRDAAFLLFDTARAWLVENHQVTAIDGPVNFGENDKYWGLLIKGFTSPSYGMNYNAPYYQSLFEAYGFKILYKQLTTCVDFRKPLPPRFNNIAQRVIGNELYTFKPFRYRNKESFIDDFVQIYNQAWASFKNFQPMDVAVVRKSLMEMKTIMDENAIWFAYANGKAAGLLLAIPDVNEILKYTSARFSWLDKCKFLFYKTFRSFSNLRVIVMGVVPEFQHRGLESGLIVNAFKASKENPHYKQIQLAWVGDFNDKMIAIHKAMGAKEDKEHAIFRKIL